MHMDVPSNGFAMEKKVISCSRFSLMIQGTLTFDLLYME